MRHLFLLIMVLMSAMASTAQSTVYLRADTVRVRKDGGVATLVIENATKDSVNGVLLNYGGGRTKFQRIKVLSDSQIVVGTDTLKIVGASKVDTSILATRAYAQKVVDDTAKVLRALAPDTTILSTKAYTQKVVNDTAKVLRTLANSYQNIYNSNGTLTGSRTVTLNGYPLSFTGDITVNSVKIGRGGGNQYENTAIGTNALSLAAYNNYTNTALGYNAGRYLDSTYGNTFIGAYAGEGTSRFFATASRNTAIGRSSMQRLTKGDDNNTLGMSALRNLTTGVNNTAVGSYIGYELTTGSYNTFIGTNAAAYYMTSGSYNTMIGEQSGLTNSGSGNVFVGYSSGAYLDTNNNTLIIQNDASSDALLRGNFLTDSLAVNGKLTLRDEPAAGDSSYRVPTTAWVKRNSTSGGGGGGGSTALSALTPATATNTINNGNYTQEWQWNSLSTQGLKLSSNSTQGSNIVNLLSLEKSGASVNANVENNGVYSSVTNTGSASTNTAGKFIASGGDINQGVYAEGKDYGIYTKSTGGNIDNSGIKSYSTGANATAVNATTYGTSGNIAAVNADAQGTSGGAIWGIRATASGAFDETYGGYFSASGGATNYALYTFEGGVVHKSLSSDGSKFVKANADGLLYLSDSVSTGAGVDTSTIATKAYAEKILNDSTAVLRTFIEGEQRVSFYKGGNSAGDNIWIGGGGQSSYSPYSYQPEYGSYNTALGDSSMFSNTTGAWNTAVGHAAMRMNQSGQNNSAFGELALRNNVNGGNNTAFGSNALRENTNSANSAFGSASLSSNTTGTNNLAVGDASMFNNTTGYRNTALGSAALLSNSTGYGNTAVGYQALLTNQTAGNATAVGYQSFYKATDGWSNAGLGYQSGYNSTSYNVTAIGGYALYGNTTGQNNTALGTQAGWDGSGASNTTGNNNIFIGNLAVGVSATESNRTWIGNNSTTSTWVGGSLLVGTKTDSGKAVAELNSTTKGFLPPRMTTTQRDAITSPPAGLMVYDTTVNKVSVYNGTTWKYLLYE